VTFLVNISVRELVCPRTKCVSLDNRMIVRIQIIAPVA